MPSDRVALAVGAGSYGGAEHYLELLAEQMRRCGADVHIVGTFETARGLDGVTYTPVRLGPKWSKRHLLRSALSAIPERRRMVRALSAAQPTVVHAQFKREQILLTRAVARRSRVVWTEHGIFPDGPYGQVLGLLYRRAARSAQRIICVSEQVRSSLVERVGISADKTVVIENAVDLTRFRPDPEARAQARQQFGFSSDDFVSVTLSRLEWDKGIDRAIDAMAVLPERHRLLIAGSGGYEKELQRRAEPLGPRVRFEGFLADVRPALLAADAFLLPSRASAREGFPTTSLLQALASGLPVLVTADSGVAADVSLWGGTIAEDGPRGVSEALLEIEQEHVQRAAAARASAQRFGLDRWRSASSLALGVSCSHTDMPVGESDPTDRAAT